ncbi:hypothetical protein GFS60_07038 (plasmid) [Rhodococcus sp. WAY2]|nr:hypothetical protein GFS60_07038 [Rhodococcus sp. WAY2]
MHRASPGLSRSNTRHASEFDPIPGTPANASGIASLHAL